MLACLKDEDASELRRPLKQTAYGGRQGRLSEIFKSASEIENLFGGGRFENFKELMSQKSEQNLPESKKFEYENMFEEASALGFVQTKKQLEQLKLDFSDEKTSVWLMSE